MYFLFSQFGCIYFDSAKLNILDTLKFLLICERNNVKNVFLLQYTDYTQTLQIYYHNFLRSYLYDVTERRPPTNKIDAKIIYVIFESIWHDAFKATDCGEVSFFENNHEIQFLSNLERSIWKGSTSNNLVFHYRQVLYSHNLINVAVKLLMIGCHSWDV